MLSRQLGAKYIALWKREYACVSARKVRMSPKEHHLVWHCHTTRNVPVCPEKEMRPVLTNGYLNRCLFHVNKVLLLGFSCTRPAAWFLTAVPWGRELPACPGSPPLPAEAMASRGAPEGSGLPMQPHQLHQGAGLPTQIPTTGQLEPHK